MNDMDHEHSPLPATARPAAERHGRQPQWLDEAVCYEIYPQSFYDANGDGIGDIRGITAKLDYVVSLGCNMLWLNACFDSPFKDAGYDVRDYRRVAPRYGTNEDLEELFRQAHLRGIHVLLDLIPGHTSEEHPWFVSSRQVTPNAYTDRYIWTDSAFHGYSMPFIGGESDRDATYILNFFKCQPALNYGFATRDQPWQSAPDSAAARHTRQAMVEVMRYWLSRGCDGFRVDMANSLVKNDGDDKPETIRAWKEMLGTITQEFPQAAFVSEWGVPGQAFQAGFNMDFYLDWRWDGTGNGYNLLARNVDDTLDAAHDHSYFNAAGGGSIKGFLDQYLPQYRTTHDRGYFCFITCNHDSPRLAPRLGERERQIACGMFMTMPGVPFLYYGDEIGMRYRPLPTKEGGYARTGSRTPMQWNSQRNLGFSQAGADQLYLPVDPAGDAPTVEEQEQRDDSMLMWTRRLLAVRTHHAALWAGASFKVVAAPEHGRSFVYCRESDAGERVLIAMNPGIDSERIELPDDILASLASGAEAGRTTSAQQLSGMQPLLGLGSFELAQDALYAGPQSFGILPLG